MRLRDAVATDAGALTAMMRASRAYSGDYQAIIRDYPVTPALIAAGVTRVADDAGAPLGFYRLIPGEGELDLMFVADDAQGQGVGRALFDDMTKAARAGLAVVRIVAHPPAADFYRRMGARDIGVQPPIGKATWSCPILELVTRAPR